MTTLTHKRAFHAGLEVLRDGLLDDPQGHDPEYDRAVAEARQGNVEPYVLYQWPGTELDPWQWEALRSLFSPDILGVWMKGSTGCGKNAVGGIAMCLAFGIWRDCKIRLTRDNYNDAVSVAFGEVDKWFRRMSVKPPGQLLTASIQDTKEHYVHVVNPQAEEGFHGVHSGHVVIWLDEATSVNLEKRFDAAMTQAHKFLATANPRTTGGYFREMFSVPNPNQNQTVTNQYGKHRLITVSAEYCRNVRDRCLRKPVAPVGGITIDGQRFRHGDSIPRELFRQRHPIIPGQVCYDEAQALLHHPDPFIRNVFGKGRFPEDDPEKQVILSSWLNRPDGPCERWARWDRLWRSAHERGMPRWILDLLDRYLPVEAFGLDVAASRHGDETVLTAGGSRGVRGQHVTQFQDTQQTVEWVLETARSQYGIDLTRGGHPVAVDWGGGYGNSVGDPLRHRGVRIVEVRGNDKSDIDPKRYYNKRAEGYGELGERIDPDGQWRDTPFLLPDDPKLKEELVAPEKIFVGHDGLRFRITPKTLPPGDKNTSIHKKLGRSPDRGDSLVYWYRALGHVGPSVEEWLDVAF